MLDTARPRACKTLTSYQPQAAASTKPGSPPTQSNWKNARIGVGWAMRNLTPTVWRVSGDIIIIKSRRIQGPRLLSSTYKPRSKSMATKNDQLHQSTTKEREEEKQKKEEAVNRSPPPPPPPEKPEPGDCCGSGCVRCVWDVYYEELEAYNKLYTSDSKNSISQSP